MDQQLVNGPSRTRPHENETISLDPVIGIRSATENQSSYQQRALHAELTKPENQASGSSFRLVHATSTAAYCDIKILFVFIFLKCIIFIFYILN